MVVQVKTSYWCVDISSLKDDYTKMKDHLGYSEMLEWLRGFGKLNVDYVIESAVCVFLNEDGEVVETVQRKASLQDILK